MSYKEMSVIGIALTTMIVMGWFFLEAWSLYQAGQPRVGDLLVLMIPLVVLTVVIEVIIEVNLAIWRRDDLVEDERDHLFSLRGEKVAGYVMQTGVIGTIAFLLIRDASELLDSASVFVAVMILVAFLTFAELTRCAVQVFHYRRGF